MQNISKVFKMLKIPSLILLVSFVANLAYGQENIIQDYVLYKNYPYLVNMTIEGEIIEFVRTAPELYKDGINENTPLPIALGPYTKAQFEIAEYLSPLNTTVVGDAVVIDSEEKVNEKAVAIKKNVDSNSSDKTSPLIKTTIIRKDAETTKAPVITRGDHAESEFQTNSLKFQGFTARLTPTLINQLKDVSKKHASSPEKLIQIRSFVTAGDDTNKKLAQNRMKACKDLLETYGIPSDKIDTGIRPYSSANEGNVSIDFVDMLDNG